MKNKQEELILDHLKSGKKITALEALELYGCLRLASRIYDLTKRGYYIESEKIKLKSGKKVAQYRLIKSLEKKLDFKKELL